MAPPAPPCEMMPPNAQITRLGCGHDRRHQQGNDLAEDAASDQSGNFVTNGAAL